VLKNLPNTLTREPRLSFHDASSLVIEGESPPGRLPLRLPVDRDDAEQTIAGSGPVSRSKSSTMPLASPPLASAPRARS
jgi:hypothetical protein